MAIPEKRDPNVPLANLNDLGDQKEVERSLRGGWRWWWVWPVIVALVIWWAGWGWGGTGGWWWGRVHEQNSRIPAPAGSRTTETLANAGAKQPQTNAGAAAGGPEGQLMTGPGVQILAANDKKQFVGKHFDVKDVPVQQKVNDRTLWIGTSNSKPMLAIVNSSADASGKNVDQGNLVDATGTVRKAPSEAQAKREWSLPDQDAKQLEEEGAYIQVSQLTVPQQ